MADEGLDLPAHPLSVKPSGNAYTSTRTIRSPFPGLSDDLLLHILEYLDASTLAFVGGTCKYLRAFSRFDELWKTHCVLKPPVPIVWRGTWYATYTGRRVTPVSCDGVFSDTLYRPFLCAHTPLEPYASNIPPQNKIARLQDLSKAEFLESWTSKPFILTAPIGHWPVYQKWSESVFRTAYGGTVFRAECVDWPMATYISYMNNTTDESPLYLFDSAFAEKMQLTADDFWSPECFGEDYFTALGEQRPDYRWLIIGPERSGSTFHKDPNGTSAWNAVITGSKYWIMFPSGASSPPPPGVFASTDQSEVTTPASIAEWLLEFHAEARQVPGCVEGICSAGEVLHVPSEWWHLVVNLEPSIAITQNFVPKAHLHGVLTFLRDQKNAISGFKEDVDDAYNLFVSSLKSAYPTDLEDALAHLRKSRKRIWKDVVNGSEDDDNGRTGFSFAFGDADSEEEVP